MDDSKIYFLDFIFNPKTRTLQKNDIKVQLRKKQADVLSLLCTKYPEPVSREDFLTGAWDGGYVTTQSIAQVIRTLRLNLDDTNKKIIVTIPKLGYRFTVKPLYKDPNPDDIHSKYGCKKREMLNHMYSKTLPEEEVIPASFDDTTEKTSALRMKEVKLINFMLIKKLFYSAVLIVAILLYIVFI